MGFHGLLQGNLLHPGIEPGSPALQADSLLSESPGKSLNWKCQEQSETKKKKKETYEKPLPLGKEPGRAQSFKAGK